MPSEIPYDLFEEQIYLATYPDIAAAVGAGTFSSGLAHFRAFGLNEGRTQISRFYSEQNYLANNSDVAAAVAGGAFRSGLQHFFLSGFDEGRFGTFGSFFNDNVYLATYPDIAAAVAAGAFGSGFQHYTNFGQAENRQATFSGTTVNDVIYAYGNVAQILGVDINIDANGFKSYGSSGAGEVDILVGGTGRDTFVLGAGSELPNVDPQPFYVDGGNADYAIIRNFTRNVDSIQLVGSPGNYAPNVVGGNLNISTSLGDLVAIVEGVTSLNVISQGTDGTFTVS